MNPFKFLSKELKIFFYLIAVRNLLRGTPLEVFRNNIDALKEYDNYNKFKAIHNKLSEKKIINADELEFLIEYEKKRQWERF